MPRSQRQSRRTPLTAVPIQTPDGVFLAYFSERGLARLNFPTRVPPASRRVLSTKVPVFIHEWTRITREAVLAVLRGDKEVTAPPLDVGAGTSFQQRVWSALRQIGFGETKSYSEVAAAVGSPKATRALGSACGANPIPLFIPCHRVLASGGKLGGFSGGLSWKMRLLAVEGTWPASSPLASRSILQESFPFAD